MLILIPHKKYFTEEDLVMHWHLGIYYPLLDKNILRNICIKVIPLRDKEIIIQGNNDKEKIDSIFSLFLKMHF